MLQEPVSSEGPEVPRSIHSTSDYIKSQYTTLMRLTLHHGSQEFSDLGCPGHGSTGLGMDVAEHGGFGL